MWRRKATVVSALLVLLAACGSESASEEPSDESAAATSSDSASPGSTVQTGSQPSETPDESLTPAPEAEGPELVPSSSFPVQNGDQITSVAVSPDGSTVVVSTQAELGTPITLTAYDASSGEVTGTTVADLIRLGRLNWMADGRLVAADLELDAGWRSWDGETLEPLPTIPQDVTCGEGRADRNSGAVYSSDGLTSMGEVLCRVDTADGSMVRSADGVLVSPERFWVLPGSGEVVVLHSPNPETSMELITLDGESLEPKGSVAFEFTDSVQAVGLTTWMTVQDSQASRLEPGAIPVPDIGGVNTSAGGSIFISDDAGLITFVSAVDGTVIGTIPSGMNLAFGDWTVDDSVLVRTTLDGRIEVYRFD